MHGKITLAPDCELELTTGVWAPGVRCHINSRPRWAWREQTGSYPSNRTISHGTWAKNKHFVNCCVVNRIKSVYDTDSKVGRWKIYSLRGTEETLSDSCCLSFGLYNAETKRDVFWKGFNPWLWQAGVCLPGKHTNAGCGSDPCHGIICERWRSFITDVYGGHA